MGDFNSDTTVGKNPLEEMEQPSESTQESKMQYLDAISKNDRIISVHFQCKSFDITVIQVYTPITNVEEAEVECFYEDLQDFLKLSRTSKDVLFNIRDWNAKVGSQEIPEVTGQFGVGVQNEPG